jgi:hypothetical protein
MAGSYGGLPRICVPYGWLKGGSPTHVSSIGPIPGS